MGIQHRHEPAQAAGCQPRTLAAEIVEELAAVDGVSEVDNASHGFINITLNAAAGAPAKSIVEVGADKNNNKDLDSGKPFNLEDSSTRLALIPAATR